jgi:hypothetical protein
MDSGCPCDFGTMVGMKNRRNGMDPELEKLVEGLTPNQIKLMASIFAGRANEIRKKHSAESLAKWKDRKAYRWN